MNKITRKRLNRANTENRIVLRQVNIDLDNIIASFTTDIETIYWLSHIPSGVPNKKRPGLDYYDNRRDRHTDDSIVSYQATYGLYENDDN